MLHKNLASFPRPLKVLLTLVIVAYALVHVFSFLEVYLKTRVQYTSAQEYFSYMSLGKLVATSHAHFFGHATMYGTLSLMFLFTSHSEKVKTVFITLALASGFLDVPSWWAIKYIGDFFEIFSGFAGVLGLTSFSYMSLRVLFELWFLKKS